LKAADNRWVRSEPTSRPLRERLAVRCPCCRAIRAKYSQTYGSAEAPFDGNRANGVRQVNGAAGLRGYRHAQRIRTDRVGGKQTARRYPLSLMQDEGFQKFMRFLWGTAIGRKLSMPRLPF
jgi:hypothetical protein